MRALRRLLVLHAALVGVLAPGSAGADGLSAFISPSYQLDDSRITDTTGRTVFTTTGLLLQDYRLSLEQSLSPTLRLNATGLYERADQNLTSPAFWQGQTAEIWNAGADLVLNTELIQAGVGYNFQHNSVRSPSAQNPLQSQDVTAYVTWRPVDLPTLALRLDKIWNYDVSRSLQDTESLDAQAILDWTYERLSLRYSVLYSDTKDSLAQSKTTAWTQVGRVTYSDSYAGGRVTLSLAGDATSTMQSFSATGPGAVVRTQQFTLPGGGLSLIEAPPATPSNSTLLPNPALVDNNFTIPAGVNIGTRPWLAGDQAFRDMGGQFPDIRPPVNAIYLYVDRSLPPEVSSAFTFTAWASEDNLQWTPIAVLGPPVFGLFANRFEIAVDRVQARYLKVVTQPLPATVTSDPRFTDIFVTEIQFFLVEQAADVAPTSFQTLASATAAVRVRLLEGVNLYYDGQAYLAWVSNPGSSSYSVSNGLSFDQRLSKALTVVARATWLDNRFGTFQQDGLQTGVSLQAVWLPTLTQSLIYSGQLLHTSAGWLRQNGLTLLNRVGLYQGVSLLAYGGFSAASSEVGVNTANANATVGVSIQPNSAFTLTGTWVYTVGRVSDPAKGTSTSNTQQGQASAGWQPFPALSVFATYTRSIQGTSPNNLWSFGGNFQPLPGAPLALRLFYNESYDAVSLQNFRSLQPGARWTIYRGWYLDVSYTAVWSRAPVQQIQTNNLFATLVITL